MPRRKSDASDTQPSDTDVASRCIEEQLQECQRGDLVIKGAGTGPISQPWPPNRARPCTSLFRRPSVLMPTSSMLYAVGSQLRIRPGKGSKDYVGTCPSQLTSTCLHTPHLAQPTSTCTQQRSSRHYLAVEHQKYSEILQVHVCHAPPLLPAAACGGDRHPQGAASPQLPWPQRPQQQDLP